MSKRIGQEEWAVSENNETDMKQNCVSTYEIELMTNCK